MFRLLDHASDVYAVDYFGILILMAIVEWFVPRRRTGDAPTRRWIGNIGISYLNTLLVRAALPLAGIAFAALCQTRGWGLMNRLGFDGWLAVAAAVVSFDLAQYLAHRLYHRVPLLWRIHLVHHNDREVDFTTGIRFHPGEAIASEVVKLAMVAMAGAAPVAVFVDSLLTAFIAFFQHANLTLPASFDRVLRLFLVTPNMHHVHHSVDKHDGQSNFGSVFPWWDRMFGTYLPAPAAGARVEFGVEGFADDKYDHIHWMLASPFLRLRQRTPDGSTSAPRYS